MWELPGLDAAIRATSKFSQGKWKENTKQTFTWILRDRVGRRRHTLGVTLPVGDDSPLFIIIKSSLALSLRNSLA